MENRRMSVAIFVRRYFARALCMLGCLLLVVASIGQAVAGTAAPGYAVTDFATGFLNAGGIGPIGLAFDPSGNLFVVNLFTGFLYKFGPAGGVASAATQVNATAIAGHPAGLAFGKDGRLYVARQAGGPGPSLGDVVELDPSNGTVIRTMASIFHATGLATDPLSGDLFVTQACLCDNAIFRISNFATGPGLGTVTTYIPLAADGIAFGADGTLYTPPQ